MCMCRIIVSDSDNSPTLTTITAHMETKYNEQKACAHRTGWNHEFKQAVHKWVCKFNWS